MFLTTMKLVVFVYLLVLILFAEAYYQHPYGVQNANPGYHIRLWFNQFFQGGGQKGFQNFVKESKKYVPGKPRTPHEDSDEGEDTAKQEPPPFKLIPVEEPSSKPMPQAVAPGPKPDVSVKKEPEPAKNDTNNPEDKTEAPINIDELPLPAKTFAFYGSSFGCQKSKVYEEFLKRYKDGSLSNLPVEDGDPSLSADDSWLKRLAEDEVDADTPATTTVEEAEAKMKDLEKEDLHLLKEGESQMPLAAQIFMRFVKVQGCQDTKLSQYQKFNEIFKEQVDNSRKKGKKYPSSYYTAKADTIILENFPRKP